MLRRWASTAARPSPPAARQISRAKRGVELLVEPSPPVLVGGGVVISRGVAVSPWKIWNGVDVAAPVGVAVSPWNWNGVGSITRVSSVQVLVAPALLPSPL